MTRLSEDDLIARYFAPLALHPGAHGLKDDAAVLSPLPGESLVVTTDALVAGVHFLPDDEPGLIARKGLRVNLSDLAAKGAVPHGFLLSLALPEGWTQDWLEAFAAGLARDATDFAFPLIGGDTVRTPGPLMLSVTAFGLVSGTTVPRRTGAQPGQGLFVTGTIGDGALGLLARTGRDADFHHGLSAEQHEALIERYLLPRPRVALAGAVKRFAAAAMDISDGFVGDLTKLLRASQVSAEIQLDAVPLSPAARAAVTASPQRLETALTGGDDYELLLAVAPEDEAAFEKAAAGAGIALARIGCVEAGMAPPRFLTAAGDERVFTRGSFSHF